MGKGRYEKGYGQDHRQNAAEYQEKNTGDQQFVAVIAVLEVNSQHYRPACQRNNRRDTQPYPRAAVGMGPAVMENQAGKQADAEFQNQCFVTEEG